MRLEDFARAGLVVEVWSAVLEEAVVPASDDARIDPGSSGPSTAHTSFGCCSGSRLRASCGAFTRSRSCFYHRRLAGGKSRQALIRHSLGRNPNAAITTSSTSTQVAGCAGTPACPGAADFQPRSGTHWAA
jgi:hypothetical protein